MYPEGTLTDFIFIIPNKYLTYLVTFVTFWLKIKNTNLTDSTDNFLVSGEGQNLIFWPTPHSCTTTVKIAFEVLVKTRLSHHIKVFDEYLNDEVTELDVDDRSHRLLLWPHQRRPEADTDVGDCHQVPATVLRHSENCNTDQNIYGSTSELITIGHRLTLRSKWK